MSGYRYADAFDPDEVEDQRGGSGLRKQLEEALGEIRSLRKELDGERRSTSIASLLKAQGKDPAVAGMIPADADPKEWLEKFSPLLPAAQPAATEVSRDGTVPQQTPEVEVHDAALEEERQALETLAVGAETGIPSTASADVIEKLKSFQSEAELLKFIQSGGAEG